MVRAIVSAGAVAILSLGAWAVEAGTASYDITIPAIPEHNIAIPEVAPVKIHYGTSAVKPEETPEPNASSPGLNRSISYGKRTPPNWGEKEEVINSGKVEVGDVNGSRVSLYLRGGFMQPEAVVSTLKSAGFSILGQYPIDQKGKLVSIVFTDDALQKAAVKPGRGFAALLRVLVDGKNGQISIMNPLYVSKAFLQGEYDAQTAEATLAKLRGAFSGLKNSKDHFKFDQLPKYRLMDAMPRYENVVEVGSGETADLVEKARASKRLVFEQPLPNGAVLLGVKLEKSSAGFVRKIGYHNAALLPYPVLIENKKAMILDPKYYIAVFYPQLSMSSFMSIASVPGVIGMECDKIFR